MPIKSLVSTLTLLISSVLSHASIADESTTDSWKHQLELGLNGASGNSDIMNVHLGFSTEFADSEKAWNFSTAYDRAKSDGDVSANRFFADLKREWIWSDIPWFSYMQGRYDWNQFKDWDDRISASSGIGYQHIKSDTWDIASRAGLGGFISRGDGEDISTPELLLALDLGWIISKYERFDFSNSLYPDLDETGEYRNLTTINWAMKMSEARNLAIKLGLKNEYDSSASETQEKNDFTYHLSLIWQI